MSHDDVTPPSTDLPDWQANREREVAEHTDLLDHLLTDAKVALTKAVAEVEALAALQADEHGAAVGVIASHTLTAAVSMIDSVRFVTVREGR